MTEPSYAVISLVQPAGKLNSPHPEALPRHVLKASNNILCLKIPPAMEGSQDLADCTFLQIVHH